MKRIFHSYDIWEDRKAGMYEYRQEEEHEIEACVSLLTNEVVFYETMKELSNNWLYATENNLSNTNNNRRAWLGRSSCCYALKVPECVTQKAWMTMTKDQMENANKTADRFILDWESRYSEQYNLFGVNYA